MSYSKSHGQQKQNQELLSFSIHEKCCLTSALKRKQENEMVKYVAQNQEKRKRGSSQSHLPTNLASRVLSSGPFLPSDRNAAQASLRRRGLHGPIKSSCRQGKGLASTAAGPGPWAPSELTSGSGLCCSHPCGLILPGRQTEHGGHRQCMSHHLTKDMTCPSLDHGCSWPHHCCQSGLAAP